MSIIQKYIFYFIVLLSFIVSTFMKVYYINSRELWLYETYTSYLISNSFYDMMKMIMGDVHPFFYYVCLKLWAKGFGFMPISLRAFSLMTNLLFCIILWFVAKNIFKNKWISLFCFLLVLFSPQFFYYSVEVRPYMCGLLFLALALFYYLKLIDCDVHIYRYAVLFAISSAVAFYSHYLTLFVIVLFFIFFLICLLKEKKPLKPFLVMLLLFSLMTAPWIPTLIHQRELKLDVRPAIKIAETNPDTLNYGYRVFRERTNTEYFVSIYYFINQQLGGIPTAIGEEFLGKWVARVSKLFIVIGLLFSIIRRNKIAVLFALICGFYIGIMFYTSMYITRYFLFLTMFILFWMGIALEQLCAFRRIRYISLLVGLLVVSSFVFQSASLLATEYCRPNSKAVEYIQENYRQSDVIIFGELSLQIPFDYYSQISNFKPREIGYPVNIYDWWDKQAYKGWKGPIITRSDLAQFVEHVVLDHQIERIWLLTTDVSKYDPGQMLLKVLSNKYQNVEKCEYYESDGQCDASNNLYLLSN
jgi:hypothetical protein